MGGLNFKFTCYHLNLITGKGLLPCPGLVKVGMLFEQALIESVIGAATTRAGCGLGFFAASCLASPLLRLIAILVEGSGRSGY